MPVANNYPICFNLILHAQNWNLFIFVFFHVNILFDDNDEKKLNFYPILLLLLLLLIMFIKGNQTNKKVLIHQRIPCFYVYSMVVIIIMLSKIFIYFLLFINIIIIINRHIYLIQTWIVTFEFIIKIKWLTISVPGKKVVIIYGFNIVNHGVLLFSLKQKSFGLQTCFFTNQLSLYK